MREAVTVDKVLRRSSSLKMLLFVFLVFLLFQFFLLFPTSVIYPLSLILLQYLHLVLDYYLNLYIVR